ncbi:HNH endonuclease [Ruania alkalisoli]|uniref:HNH endonuclease n=1 Tax=Ruania alkalisoli TaxID=2779775 RepID=A0A7M1SRJ7_9MICO|nr:HNH endonuclease signature motif containing protein [Ruania alkalisoli]QOR70105.1 HNH endonuclease [Ruania alkalisoli]
MRPVIDLAEDYSATTYEASPKLREQAILRDRTCAFPFCNRLARSADRDHITPHEQGGPTRSANLGSLCRRHHRCKTHDGWSYVMLNPGTYYWCDPHGTQYLVTPATTFLLPGTRGGPVVRARQRALASMRATAQGMPNRRHQVRPFTGEHAPASRTHQTTAYTSTGRIAGTGGTDPPPF